MENFDDFMIHKVKTAYQPNGFSVNFGGGYSFDTDGGYPPLKRFTLTFEGYMYYMKLVNGVEVVDKEKNKNINNLGALEDFYLRHLTHKTFEYNSPVYGKVYVRFAEPLNIPEGITNGHGLVEKFDVTLKEVFA
jgi:phage-related protein